MNLKATLFSLLAFALSFAAVSAAPLSYNLAGNNTLLADGVSNVYTSNGVNLTVTSWSLANLASTFSTASTGLWSPGLGVCNDSEVAAGCSPNTHTVDNVAGYDFILFQFSAPVSGASFSLKAFGDTDVTYWTSASSFASGALAGKTVGDIINPPFGFGPMTTNSGGSVDRSVAINGTGISSILLGAAYSLNNCDDLFKIAGIAATSSTTPPPPGQVPEPSTFAMLGGALVGLSVALRRRTA
ncbi:MAG: PEP-CTERM sorting domain-containing protein [Acidobacteria bacterium]|nr:PEP-CTERM sorting domain-containing protein [Acidobacteriota bacterium]